MNNVQLTVDNYPEGSKVKRWGEEGKTGSHGRKLPLDDRGQVPDVIGVSKVTSPVPTIIHSPFSHFTLHT